MSTNGKRSLLSASERKLVSTLQATAAEFAACRRWDAAQMLLDAALAVEATRGNDRSDESLRILLEVARVETEMGHLRAAAFRAEKVLRVTANRRLRQTARRRLKRIESLQARASIRHKSNMVGTFELFVPEPIESTVSFSDVGGLWGVKEQVMRLGITPKLSPDRAARYGVQCGGALLLHGPPGCGKTLIAQATAHEMGAPLYVVKASDIMHPFMGMDERNLAAVFDTARDVGRCVIFFDELDGMVPARHEGMIEARRSLVNAFLAELDGATRNPDCLIVGATNAIDLIDPAVQRRGRFDKLIYVGPPDDVARDAIFRISLANKPLSPDIDYDLLVKLSTNMSGADIDGAVRDAVQQVWIQSEREDCDRDIAMADLLIALIRVVPDGRQREGIRQILVDGFSDSLDA